MNEYKTTFADWWPSFPKTMTPPKDLYTSAEPPNPVAPQIASGGYREQATRSVRLVSTQVCSSSTARFHFFWTWEIE